jgi:hypothetical protein
VISDRWSDFPALEFCALVLPSQGACDLAWTSPVRQIARYPNFCAASSILLVALVGRVLLDVAMTALSVEILPARNSFFHLNLWI